MTELETSGRRLAADVKNVLGDIDQFLGALRGESSAATAELRGRYDAALLRSKMRLAELRAVSTARTRRAVAETDLFAHQHPWRTAGFAAAGGALLGALLAALATRR